MAGDKITAKQMDKAFQRGDEVDATSSEQENPRPRQGQYPPDNQPTPLDDGYPTATTEGAASDSGELGYLSPRLNRHSGDTEHDDILTDPNAAADRRDQPRCLG